MQSAEVTDERPAQGLACGDGGKRVPKVLQLAKACKGLRRRRGNARYRSRSRRVRRRARERESVLPVCDLRNRPKAVSAWPRDEGAAPLGGRDETAPKSSLRSVGAARESAPSSRLRLPSMMSRVVKAARNQGVATVPGGPSPGKPRVLSNRLFGVTKSETVWVSRACGETAP